MGRWIAIVAVLLLAGCASTRDYYYADGYYGRDYGHDRYGHGYYAGGSVYHRGDAGHGDYWFGQSYRYPGYFDSPYYYSLFWPINRWYYDPFWYPGYHYGVTWFPRNYLSFSVGFGHGWGSWGHFAYSPYRYGWSDWAYDWYPWYRTYPNYAGYYGRPRFGDARNEAERLARLSGAHRAYKQRGLLASRGGGLPVAGRPVGLRGSEARGLPSRGLPAPTSRSLPARSRAGAGEGTALPRSAPRASLRPERDSSARFPLGRGRAAVGPEFGQERGLPRREAAYAQRDRERLQPARAYAEARYRNEADFAPRGMERLPTRSHAPSERAYAPAARGYAPPQGRAPVQRGGYGVGARSAPSMPARSAAPAPRMERSVPASRSAPERSGRSSRGRDGDEPR